MEPDDKELNTLLKEWKLPVAPASLDNKLFSARQPWWNGSIRIPVPVALAIAAALVVMAVALLRQHPATKPPETSVDLADFRPVANMNYRIIRRTK